MDVMTWAGLISLRINTNVNKIIKIPEFLKNLVSPATIYFSGRNIFVEVPFI
jgi:hypothetical protein